MDVQQRVRLVRDDLSDRDIAALVWLNRQRPSAPACGICARGRYAHIAYVSSLV